LIDSAGIQGALSTRNKSEGRGEKETEKGVRKREWQGIIEGGRYPCISIIIIDNYHN